MKLYAYRYCPFSRRVRIALAEHEVEFEYVELEPDAPHPQELGGKTPTDSGVPVLFVREDFVLFDSTAIIQWIDSAYPRSLLPSQREPASIARSWEGWITSKLFSKIEDASKIEDDDRAKLLELLRGIEPMVGDEWLAGDEFSVADVALGPVVAVLRSKEIESLPPRVRAYVGRLRARPSVRLVGELDAPVERPSFAA